MPLLSKTQQMIERMRQGQTAVQQASTEDRPIPARPEIKVEGTRTGYIVHAKLTVDLEGSNPPYLTKSGKSYTCGSTQGYEGKALLIPSGPMKGMTTYTILRNTLPSGQTPEPQPPTLVEKLAAAGLTEDQIKAVFEMKTPKPRM